MSEEPKYRFETLAVHAGQETPDPSTDARAVPIYMTTSYVFDSFETAANRFALTDPGYIYTRLGNPTTDVFEKRMAALEGGQGALAFSSGAAAVTGAMLNIMGAGAHIVSDIAIYGGTYNLFAHTFKELGIDCSFVDASDPLRVEAAIMENTKAVFIESMGNPNCTLLDLEKISEIAHAHGIPVIIDNTFATPFLLRPIEYGCDIVVHSATKFIGGHGVAMGGVVIDSGRFDWAASGKFPSLSEPNPSYHGAVFTNIAGAQAFIAKLRAAYLRDTGAVLSPMNSFMLLQSLQTLGLRVERHVENTEKTVQFLASHPRVKRVNHPMLQENRDHALYGKYFPKGGGSIFTFEINGGLEAARSFINSLKLFSNLANVADVKSLVIHPASTTHSQMSPQELEASGITPSTIRLSIGIENADDILEALSDALEASK
ncbi:MAG: O-acetylhomoserine aminocarboxypropyltransferase/cysteine synthase [Eubacteriaceae bacterium]|jgi:O-acetylhomoserine (thiol)-lyase|nr:O-acetylhomoserine aminocarboxypropyltransferase/cysteine synthase [Eubacteriaceae bacterium]